MGKQSILIVDADARSLRVVEVTLRSAGHDVIPCSSATAALATLKTLKPDILLTDTRLSDLDGFELVRRIRSDRHLDDMSIIFLSSDATIESKVRGLELGADDYFTKPVYIREVVERVNQEAERHRERGTAHSGETRMRMRGMLNELSFPEIVQTLGVSQKSGVVYLVGPKKVCGVVYFDQGKLVDARVGEMRGQEAAYRMMQWNEGHFDVEFRPIRSSKRTIDQSNESLILEGARQIDERAQLAQRLPGLNTGVCIDAVHLTNHRNRLSELEQELVAAAKSKLTVAQLLMLPGRNEYDLLTALVNLVELGVIREVTDSYSTNAPAEPTQEEIDARRMAETLPGADVVELTEFRVGSAGEFVLMESDLEEVNPAPQSNSTSMVGWDDTLLELLRDPSVCEAVDHVSNSLPPGAAARATAPTDEIDAAIARGERARAGVDSLEVSLAPVTRLQPRDYPLNTTRESGSVPKRNSLASMADRFMSRLSSRG